ncbi:peptidase C1B, bleomycin hydrolase [Trichophaea hybrida]|nr:peptidase C1B, bleomycin hydrolase [Trichophaea hybrida]
MGNSHSKRARFTTKTYPVERKRTTASRSSDLTLTSTIDANDTTPTLNVATIAKWEEKLLSDPKNRLALSALTTHAATAILQNPTVLLQDTHLFSDKVEMGTPVTNQRSSGRCWLFAATNVFRVGLIKKYKLPGFEFSQSYLFFWDKLEKANFFLEQIVDTASEPLNGRLVQYLLNAPVGDGGQWDMVVNLVEKYGLVPQTVFPDSFNAKASGRINWLITAKLREAALHLRDLATTTEKPPTDEIQKYKTKVLQAIHGILVLSLGAPPKPTDTFTWSFINKDQKYHSISSSPIAFYHDNVGSLPSLLTLGLSSPHGVKDRFSLVNDPRNLYMRLLTIPRLGNIVAGRGVTYVNVPMETIKSTVINMLKSGQPVFFGCDVGKYSDPTRGILDTALFDYELGFNVSLSLTKAQRLETGESSMTHAMVLSGVNLVDGKPTRWRVENSWGADKGEKGYLVMADEWMDEFVYQAVVAPEFVGEEVRKVLLQDPIRLEIWDPMGSLA